MKFPKEVKTYCPYCRQHTVHKAKIASKGRGRTLARGNRKHERILMGHGGKRAGKKPVKKQAKHQKLILQCTVCKKKHEKVVGGRTKKKIEVR